MTRTVPPEHHTRKLRQLVRDEIMSRHTGNWLPLVPYLLTMWKPDQPMPPGTIALYLKLRAITAPGARPALSAALHGRRVCPPGAAYAPVGWREFIEEEAAKAAKDAQ